MLAADSTGSMHRLTARLLLLFALVGTLAPLGLAVTAAPPHACCRRKASHGCHEMAVVEPSGPAIRDAKCCNQDCCRAATTTPQWAQAQPKLSAFFLRTIDLPLAASQPHFPAAASVQFPSSRAPPAC